MAVHQLTLAGYAVPSANVLLRCHWSRRARLVREAGERVAIEAHVQGVPRAVGRRRVSVRVTRRGGGDVDNCLKVTLDALVLAGLLVDDSGRWCELGEVLVLRGRPETVVWLTDIADVEG